MLLSEIKHDLNNFAFILLFIFLLEALRDKLKVFTAFLKELREEIAQKEYRYTRCNDSFEDN